MRAYFGRRYHLSASHRLHSRAFNEDRNRAVYGKCNNPHGHGHNYIIEVTRRRQYRSRNRHGLRSGRTRFLWCRKNARSLRPHQPQHARALSNHLSRQQKIYYALHCLLTAAFHQAEIDLVRVEETANNSFEFSVHDLNAPQRNVHPG